MSPFTSSVGRLFDAAASLMGIRHHAAFEAQAAMELEAVATEAWRNGAPVGPDGDAVIRRPDPDGRSASGGPDAPLRPGRPWIWDPSPIIRMVVRSRLEGRPVAEAAAAFHRAVIGGVVTGCLRIRCDTGLETVALSGGVFQNRLLLKGAVEGLEREGFRVLRHRRVPLNDGGLSLGQVAVAMARLERRPVEEPGESRRRAAGHPSPSLLQSVAEGG